MAFLTFMISTFSSLLSIIVDRFSFTIIIIINRVDIWLTTTFTLDQSYVGSLACVMEWIETLMASSNQNFECFILYG